MENKYKVGSMFAGIGGICLGFKKAGADVVWANEIDKNACTTYRENFGSSYLMEADINDVATKDIPEIDILTAGFPCQPFSIAGYQKGFEDNRGNLFLEIIRVLQDKQPKAFLLENVKNLDSHDNGHTIKVIETALKENGYFIKKDILNTAKYGNIPQNRERIYIVGFKDKEFCDKFEFPTEIKLTTKIGDIIKPEEKKPKQFYYDTSKYYPVLKETMKNPNTIYQWRRIYCRENKNELCPTLTANMGTGGHNVPLVIDNYDIRKLTPKECLLFQGFPKDYKIPANMGNSHIYKQAGNAVSVPVVQRVAQEMIRVLNDKN